VWISLKILIQKLWRHLLTTTGMPSLLLYELSIDSDHFVSRLVVCRCSDSSCNSIESSLLTVDYQLRFLALFSLCVLIHRRSADLVCYYAIACNQILVLVVTLGLHVVLQARSQGGFGGSIEPT
jgi:hypothetical protein